MNAKEFWEIVIKKDHVHIIFLCLANICRSPYAEMMFEKLLQQSKVVHKEKFKIQSGGFITQGTINIHPLTEQALIEDGVSQARVKQFHTRTMRKHKEDLEAADVLVVMDKSQRDIQVPLKYRGKTIILAEMSANEDVDIKDPVLIKEYGPYREIMNQIKKYLEICITRLEKE